MSPKEALRRRERGAAALELAMAAPLLVVLGALSLNLVAYVHAYLQADSAATAAARYVINQGSTTLTRAKVESYLSEAFPELGFGEGSSVTAFQKDTPQTDRYSYHLYDGSEATTLDASESHQAFTVSVSVQTPWPALAGMMGDGGGTFDVQATASGILDRTSGTAWGLAA